VITGEIVAWVEVEKSCFDRDQPLFLKYTGLEGPGDDIVDVSTDCSIHAQAGLPC